MKPRIAVLGMLEQLRDNLVGGQQVQNMQVILNIHLGAGAHVHKDKPRRDSRIYAPSFSYALFRSSCTSTVHTLAGTRRYYKCISYSIDNHKTTSQTCAACIEQVRIPLFT